MTITFIPARQRPAAPTEGSQTDAISPLSDVVGYVASNPVAVFLGYFLLLNALVWFLFWLDKRRAILNEWRISENTLLMLALLGGTIGAFAARKVFRHKTRKQPFVGQLYGIALFQIVIVAVPVGYFLVV